MTSNNKRHSNITSASNNHHDTESMHNNNEMIGGAENLSISASDGDSGLPAILPGENLDSIAQVVSFKRENNHNNNNMYLSYDVDEAGYSVWKFVSKFVDHVCIEGNLNDSQRQSLHHNLSEVISMQIQMLDTVYKESKRIPLRTKPKFEILKPDFIFHGEYFIEPTPLRCHLVPDGREEINGLSGGTVILPAEGALFLTNYRIIYRGFPINDSLMSDAIITRSFPISALIKEKKIGNQFRLGTNTNSILSNSLTTLNNPGTYEMASLHDGIQMRSSTFQLIKVFFDEEVSTDKIEKFRHSLLKLRYPQSVLEFFCFNQNNTKYPYSNGTFNSIQTTKNGFKNYSVLSKETSVNSIGTSQSEFYPHTLNIKTKEKGTDALRYYLLYFCVI
jgi:myotubularin-related protein 5/13